MKSAARSTLIQKTRQLLVVIALLVTAMALGTTTAAAQSEPGNTIFIPILRQGSQEVVYLTYDLSDPGNSPWDQILELFGSQEVLVTRSATSLGITDVYLGQERPLIELRLRCTTCDPDGADSGSVAGARVQAPETFILVFPLLDGRRTIEAEVISRREVLLRLLDPDADPQVLPLLRARCARYETCYVEVVEMVPAAPPTITSTPVTAAVVGQDYAYDVEASGSPPLSYALTSAPQGMSIDPATGVIAWIPSAAGSVDVTVEATNSADTAIQSFSIAVAHASTPPTITSTPVTAAVVGQDYAYDVEASGSPSPSYALTSAPQGMSIDPETGIIAWTPASAGTVDVTVEATNSADTAIQSFSIAVADASTPPAITSTPVTTAVVGQAYAYDVNASGSPAPTYALTSAPQGMSIDPETGIIAWIPNAAGNVDVIVEATNSADTAIQSFSIQVIETPPPPEPGTGSIVFVSRQIPRVGSVNYLESGSMPGVGSFSRFQVAAPGKLIIREPNGSLRTLVDGSRPTADSLNLIDVNAPDVSYDGTQIVFAGLPNGDYGSGWGQNPGAWRIYVINVDGTGLRQITFSDQGDLDLTQFEGAAGAFARYDDTDPVWLPGGRIVFASTRWPSYGMYIDARTTNLHVVNADGTNLHRITAERNGAERPLVDPLTGKIVFSRWWRNYRIASNDVDAVVESPLGGYRQHLGLVAEEFGVELGEVPGAAQSRNAWFLASINPDGTDMQQWAGTSSIGSGQFDNFGYGGSFTADGVLYTNFFPLTHLGDAAGFGGIRRFERGPKGYTPIMGITNTIGYDLVSKNPPSYLVYRSAYATEPEIRADGSMILSWAPDTEQDYGLYTATTDGSNLTPLYDNPGTTELRAREIRPRPRPPVIEDQIVQTASLLPPSADGPYDIDGNYLFNALNVYFNAPVDFGVPNAMPVGSAGSIRFFIDHQRTATGSQSWRDWPIFLQEVPVNPDGSVTTVSPANVPVFEQIRSPQPEYTVPLVGTRGDERGAAHVAGLNFGRPGENQSCVGCHAGHSMIPVPENPEDAQWTNLAPGATISVSSSHPDFGNRYGLTDRQVQTGDYWRRHWVSDPNQSPSSQWLELVFPVPVSVRTVRLYDMPSAGGGNIQVGSASISLYSDTAGQVEVARQTTGALSEAGTDVVFSDVQVHIVRVQLDNVTGTYFDRAVAGLAEIEVIARGEQGP